MNYIELTKKFRTKCIDCKDKECKALQEKLINDKYHKKYDAINKEVKHERDNRNDGR